MSRRNKIELARAQKRRHFKRVVSLSPRRRPNADGKTSHAKTSSAYTLMQTQVHVKRLSVGVFRIW